MGIHRVYPPAFDILFAADCDADPRYWAPSGRSLPLHKPVYLFVRRKIKRVGTLRRCWMLDTGYGSTELAEVWISRNAPGWDPETSGIQDHVIFPITFIKTP